MRPALCTGIPARLVFPGGGIFFWWQAGAITSLSKRIDLSTVPCYAAAPVQAGDKNVAKDYQTPDAPQTEPRSSQVAPTNRFQTHLSFCMRAGALAATLAACDVDMDLALVSSGPSRCATSQVPWTVGHGACAYVETKPDMAGQSRPNVAQTSDWLGSPIALRAV